MTEQQISKRQFHLRLTDHDGNVVVDGDADEGQKVTAKTVTLWWDGAVGEQEYTFRDPGVWVENGYVYITWTDDTDRNPRKREPANVKTIVEQPLPGGGVVGPFIVIVV